jgi:rubrerythrin
VLCDEEKRHLTYLNERLDEWKSTGKITVGKIATTIPTKKAIDEGIAKLRANVEKKQGAEYDTELEMLRRALQVEVETSTFYKKMVEELDAEGQEMFTRFVEIEEGHQAIVQAEIDAVSGMGFWFDSREFSLEME